MNNCLNLKYSGEFSKNQVEAIFLGGTRYSKIEIKSELLDVLTNVIKDSFSYSFNSYRDYDKFMIKMRRKYKYNLVISKTKIFLLLKIHYFSKTNYY